MIELTDKQKADIMLGVYFKTQAAVEKYLGAEKLPEWTTYVAKQFSDNIHKTSASESEIAKRVIFELAEVLSIYGSDYEIVENDDSIVLDVNYCGIFKYRHIAEEKGVELTLGLPCEFCTDFRHKIAKQLNVHTLSHELKNCGCKWVESLNE